MDTIEEKVKHISSKDFWYIVNISYISLKIRNSLFIFIVPYQQVSFHSSPVMDFYYQYREVAEYYSIPRSLT